MSYERASAPARNLKVIPKFRIDAEIDAQSTSRSGHWRLIAGRRLPTSGRSLYLFNCFPAPFSKLQRITLIYTSTEPHGVVRKVRGQDGVASPFFLVRLSFIPHNMPVYPGAPGRIKDQGSLTLLSLPSRRNLRPSSSYRSGWLFQGPNWSKTRSGFHPD
jgi:hypothetical protein